MLEASWCHYQQNLWPFGPEGQILCNSYPEEAQVVVLHCCTPYKEVDVTPTPLVVQSNLESGKCLRLKKSSPHISV